MGRVFGGGVFLRCSDYFFLIPLEFLSSFPPPIRVEGRLQRESRKMDPRFRGDDNMKLEINFSLLQKISLGVLASSLTFLCLFFFPKNLASDKLLKLYFFTVGQGDSMLILTPQGDSILIDGGPDDTVMRSLDEVIPYWDRKLDYMFLTHLHADHVNGLLDVLEQYEVGKVFWNNYSYSSPQAEAWVKALSDFKGEVLPFEKNDRLLLGDTSLEALWPPKDVVFEEDLNNNSMIFQLEYGDFDALLLGDAGGDIQPLVDWPNDVEVLKVSHHGAAGDFWQGLLEIAKPILAVISVGENDFGHPSQSTLNLLSRFGVKTYRTDLDGTIEVWTDGRLWGVE